ncbi:DUF3267 domain-containing protein (plasmid) [Halobellus limi]|uniref:DUF3267 domain-containing protein n=2 Tax=Halobellus limi TaxID=699433 RepID=A0A1H6CEQ8_9EURY|nr:DUF3267 domain-containing protein [Halobellus limi]SEG71444.1 Putative zincin peptidase [Halobellus limi]
MKYQKVIMSADESPGENQTDDVLIAEYGMSRPLVLQWTVVSILGFVVALFGLLLLYYGVTGDATGTELVVTPDTGWWNLGLTIAVLVGVLLLVIVPHELCHGFGIRFFGGEPRFGLGVAYFVFPYAFATTETRFSRNQFIAIALAPLVLLSLLGVPLMLVFEWPWLALPLALNAGGAVGDLWMALTLMRYPPAVTVVDTTTGLEIYGTPSLERTETAPATVVWDLLVGIAGSIVILAVCGGILAPLVLAAIGLDSFTLGVPDTPLLILEFVQTPDGGIEFTMGTGILAVGVFTGICYAYLRASGRR